MAAREINVRILLVEDSKTIRRENTSALQNAGYEVICAEDGESALQMAQEQHPDLILLDMILPKMSGPEVLQHLKREPATAEIPVVVLSSLSEKNRQKLLDEGAESRFPTSPSTTEALQSLLQVFFRRKIGARQKQQSRQESPEHHGHRQGERTIHFLKIQPGQSQDVSILQRLREQSHDDGRGEHRSRRNFPVGQKPVNQKENGNAGQDGEKLHHQKSHHPHQARAVAAQQKLHERDRSRGQCD